MTILELACVLFCENEHRQNGLSLVPKKILTLVPWEATSAGKKVTILLSLYPRVPPY